MLKRKLIWQIYMLLFIIVTLRTISVCCDDVLNEQGNVEAGPNAASQSNSDYVYENFSKKSHYSNFNVNETETKPSKEELLEMTFGPRNKPLTFVIVMSTIYILILMCGIIGNISTCFVVIFNNCMHTTTNYYLFSLAVSDVLSLLMGLPPELYSIIIEAYPWAFGETFCVVRTFIFETTTIASVLTILTFTFERWLHICKAIYAKKFSSDFSRALKIIVFIWLLSGLLAMPYAFTTGVYYQYPDYVESKTCNILAKYKDFMKTVIQLSVLLLFIMPMTLISIMYILIGITLWKSQNKYQCTSTFSSTKTTSTKSNGSHMSNSNRLSTFLNTHLYLNPNRKSLSASNGKLANAHAINSESNFPQFLKGQDTLMVNRPGANMTRNLSDFSMADYSVNQIYNLNNLNQNNNANNNNNLATSDRASKEFEHISYRARQSRRDVVKMLFVVVLAFFTCWAPYHLQRFITTYYQPSSEFMMKIFEIIFYISGISIYISSTINPILYNVMSKRYRTAFKNTLKMICSCSWSTKSNHAFKSSKYYSAINFNAINSNHLNSRRRNNV